MVRMTSIAALTLGTLAISGWVAAAWLVLSASVSSDVREVIHANPLLAGAAAFLFGILALGLAAAIGRNRSHLAPATVEARIGYLQDRLVGSAELVTDLRGQIARFETAKSHQSTMMPDGFMSELDREIIDGNTEREAALAERYLETHSEALLRALTTLARVALMEDKADEAVIEHRRTLGLALVGLSVYCGDDAARDLSYKLIPAEALARDAA